MRTAAIMAAAAACGAAAFVWALSTAKPPPRPWRGPVGAARAAPEARPTDLEGLEAHVAREPEDADAWFALAERRRDAGNLGGEQEAWGRVKDLSLPVTRRQREDPRAWFNLAWASDKLGAAEGAAAWPRARELYEARAESPRAGSWRFWQRLGWCRARTGQAEAAREAWAHGLSLLRVQEGAIGEGSPADPERSRQLARAMTLAGDIDGALQLLERTVNAWEPGALEHDEALAALRGSERFRALVLRAGSPGRVMEAR